MVRDLKYVWSTVIRPTLVDLKGDAFFFSTPKGRNGFWQLWQTADADGWGRWQMPSHVNPHIPRSELDAMARDLPERVYRQEVDAQFLDDEGAVFRNVQACVGDASHTGTTIFGIDVGRTDDYTVCVVIDAKTKGVLAIDRYTGVSFIQQEQRILAMAERWKPAAIIVEVNNFGLPFAESLAQKQLPVVPFTTTNASKQVIIDHLSLGFERQALTIPNDHILIGELMSFEMSKTATGLMRFAAPDGQHDDTVMALAFAYYGTGNY